MKTIWVALYNNMDGESNIVAISESFDRLEAAVLQRVNEVVNDCEDVGYERSEEGEEVTYGVGDKYFSDDTGEELDLEPFEWYTLAKHPLV